MSKFVHQSQQVLSISDIVEDGDPLSKTEVTQEQELPEEEDTKTEKLLNEVKKNQYLEATLLHLQVHWEKMLQMKQSRSKSCKGGLEAMSSLNCLTHLCSMLMSKVLCVEQ